jgi:hypothetical protein
MSFLGISIGTIKRQCGERKNSQRKHFPNVFTNFNFSWHKLSNTLDKLKIVFRGRNSHLGSTGWAKMQLISLWTERLNIESRLTHLGHSS